jgi:Polyketide cyclase / dehydrase and lipid transport
MSATVVSAEVDQPAATVFTYATDPTRFHEWQEGVVDGRLDLADGESATVGSRCIMTRRIGGANRPSTSLITHLERPRTWGVRGIDGPIRAMVDLTVEQLTTRRSRLTISVDFEGHGIGKVLVPLLVRRQARQEMPRNIAELKRRIESLAQ